MRRWRQIAQKQRRKPQRARESVALEAAKLLYHESCEEYIEAKRLAAQNLGLKALPSNREVAVKLLEYALLMEGNEYWERLVELREDAFLLMSSLSRFKPRLIGSVWRGIIKPSSDIDIELDFTNPEPVKHELINNDYEILEEGAVEVSEPLKQGSVWKIKVKTKLGHEAEIILKEHKWYVNPPKCEIMGDVRKGLNLMELRRVLREEPDKLFIPEGS